MCQIAHPHHAEAQPQLHAPSTTVAAYTTTPQPQAPTPTPTPTPPRRNKNVQLTLRYALLLSATSSLLTQSPLSYYIHDLKHDSNLAVGLVIGAQGTVALLVALPSAVAADYCGRQRMLRAAAAVGLLALAFHATCLFYLPGRVSDDALFKCFIGVSSTWGVFMGMHSAPLEALFGDSVESGRRSRLYVRRSALRTVGSALGPLLSIPVFALSGDQWTPDELTRVMAVGIVIGLLPCACLWLFRDEFALGAASESLAETSRCRAERENGCEGGVVAPLCAAAALGGGGGAAGSADGGEDRRADSDSSAGGKRCNLSAGGSFAGSSTTRPAMDAPLLPELQAPTPLPLHAPAPPPRTRRRWLPALRASAIAPLIATSDVIAMLAAGLSTAFFPIFFGDTLHLPPVVVQSVLVASPLGIATSSVVAQRLTLHLGRVPVIIATRSAGLVMLVLLSLVGDAALALTLYLLFRWLTNCCSGLNKSILNDYVPKRSRARWNTLESFNLVTWSGSALLGGYLSDHVTYRDVFRITAALHVVSVVLVAPLLSLVHDEKDAREWRLRRVGVRRVGV